MTRRKTIGKDPLAELPGGFEITDAVAATIMIPAAADASPAPDEDPAIDRSEAVRVEDHGGQRAVGGKLEILGGSLGSGIGIILRVGPSARLGVVAPTGRLIDFGAELEAVLAWPDRGDHRLLSAAGWAWVLASLGGAIGLVAGSGLRLLIPRRMIAKIRLHDGSELLARTDGATVTALEAVARARALRRGGPVPA